MKGSRMKVVLDCADPQALAPFWAEALGYRIRGSVGAYTLLNPDGVEGPPLLLQRVPEPKGGKNRMHIDIQSDDIEKEASRLEAIGAKRLDGPQQDPGIDEQWIVMADPQGNEFCVCAG